MMMGKKIKVELSGGRDQDGGDGGSVTSRKVFVANLHDDVNEDELSQIFSKYGKIDDILVLKKN